MNLNKTCYCQLQYSVDYEYIENVLLEKQRIRKITKHSKREVYVEEYYDFNSLKIRLSSIHSLVIQGYKNQGIEDIYSDLCSFPEFEVWNRFDDCISFGVSTSGWSISIMFFNYLWDYFREKYGEFEGDRRYHELADSKEIWFYPDRRTELNFASACNLISEETAHIILKEFLDRKTDDQLDPDIFRKEILKRNY